MDAAHSAGKARKKRIRAERNGIDLTFLFLVLILLSIGLIMMFSASYASSYYETGDSFYYIKRQLLFAVVGVVMMLAIANIDYHILHRFAFLIYAGTLFLLVVVLIVPTREDAKRWINLGFTTFQPSELAKFAIVLIFAHLISVNYERMKNPRYGVWPFLVLLGVVVMLMLLEPHLSGTILIVSIGVVMMFVGGTDLKWFMLGGVLIGVAIIAAVLIPGVVPYAMDRLQYWIDPWSDPQNKGFQTIQSLYAIGSGGLMGVGIGNSRQKHLYLPEPHNDFVFSVVCEELGFIGATLIILLFVLLIWRGYVVAMRCRDRFGSMLAVGLTTQVGVQTVLNIAVVSNTIPNTGISLPFFSYGGTALVMLLCEMGVILSVSRQTNIEKE
ncbi:putative lipid II flippase FtsW [Anaerotruncus colihominis]|uniref:Probable peptidoglycan glycosyltransferase FtsW n=1 Tax=Anaerotruncus colihominis TaxID=169435 RepID=A0A1Y4MLJ0_9FIRM|nr:putative lipid II flippase FtsW [Anaerotruncus colihominis]OUP69585.1 putative lipid II flippase FtsW [Anaerotruncus colihominis]OUP74319.1 putative lipid II flippase FtsW [Anaerotruncus colihominis]